MEQRLCSVLRGEYAEWPPDAGPAEQMQFLDAAASHGVEPLLVHHLHATNLLEQWPARIREPLKQAARIEVLIEEFRRLDLLELLRRMAGVKVDALLMKGQAVAYAYYPTPFLRPRSDVDLLIRKDDEDTVNSLMEKLGFHRRLQTPGEFIMPQSQFVKQDPFGTRHAYDVHRRISNPQAFAGVLTFEDLASRSIELPDLGPHARTLGHVDALLLACVHRVAHHFDDNSRLLWLYDIHLMAGRMDRPAFERFAALAVEKQVATVCASSLTLAERRFHTKLPSDLLATLRAHGAGEPSAAYLRRRMSLLDVLRSDLRMLAGWRAKWRLLHQHLFPPSSYLLERYQLPHRALLPAFYAYRVVRGAPKWFRRPDHRKLPSVKRGAPSGRE